MVALVLRIRAYIAVLDEPGANLVVRPSRPERVLSREIVIPEKKRIFVHEYDRAHLNEYNVRDQLEHLIAGGLGVALHDAVVNEPFLELGIRPRRVNSVGDRVVILVHELYKSLTLFLRIGFNEIM